MSQMAQAHSKRTREGHEGKMTLQILGGREGGREGGGKQLMERMTEEDLYINTIVFIGSNE